jgi:outer membrane protein assembly factor BamB
MTQPKMACGLIRRSRPIRRGSRWLAPWSGAAWITAIALCGAPAVAVPVAGASDTQNWPQWRGPLGTGAAPSANPPSEWSETKNVRWKVKIPGEGSSTPIIWGNRVFVETAIPTGKKVDSAATKTQETAKSDSPPPQSSGRLVDRFDVNKDGKISRAEVPEGSLRDIFDRMVERYKLDPAKVYTREELEKAMGGAESEPAAKAQNPQRPGDGQRRPGGGPGGPGGPGGMRGAKPTELYQFALLCLDRQTGKVIWQQTACEELPHEGHHPTGSFAASSPVTDGKHIYAYFGSRGLYCYDMDGTLVWKKDFGDMRIANGFGEGSSPALAGAAIIVQWDNEGDSFIIALDKATGETLWKKPREERTSWSTPLLVEHDGRSQIVTAATRKVRSYDLGSGDIIWECAGLGPNTIPSPVASDGMVYAMSGFQRNALLAIRLGAQGDLTESKSVVWKLNKGTPYVPSPLLYEDRLYFFAGTNPVLSCYDAKSGTALVETIRLDGMQGVYASPVGAGGRVYLVSREGVTLVIKRSDKFEKLATNRLDERFDASPAIAGNEIYLRGHEYLYCIAE